MPSPSFTVWRPPLCERHKSEAIAGRLVISIFVLMRDIMR